MNTSTAPEPDAADPGQSVAKGGDGVLHRLLEGLGKPAVDTLNYVGALGWLAVDALSWVYRSVVLRRVRFGRFALRGDGRGDVLSGDTGTLVLNL